jgi:hypothetical protein
VKLSDTKIRNLKPKEKPYKLADAGGLYIFVQPCGSKLWRLKYRFLGREKTMSYGPYPLVSLKEAREKRDRDKKLLLGPRTESGPVLPSVSRSAYSTETV